MKLNILKKTEQIAIIGAGGQAVSAYEIFCDSGFEVKYFVATP